MTVKKLIGQAPSQAPRNRDLGSMAYQDANNYYSTAVQPTFRNRIINGDFNIWQRSTAASSGGGYCSADRWSPYATQTSVANYALNLNRVQDHPIANGGYCGSISQVNTNASTTYITLGQRIEAANLSDLGAGQVMTLSFYVKRMQAASAATTLSVYVRSPSTKDTYAYNVNLNYYDVVVATPFSTTFNNIDTNWQKVVCSFSVTSGMATNGCNVFFEIANSNGIGFGNTNEIMRVACVQLEKGTVATPFEFRPYGTELALCQRYYYKNIGQGSIYIETYAASGSFPLVSYSHPVQMRSVPTTTFIGTFTYSYCQSLNVNTQTAIQAMFNVTANQAGATRVYCISDASSGYQCTSEL